MTRQNEQTLTFFDILGGRYTLSPQEFVALMRHKTTLTYLAVVYVLLVMTDVPDLRGRIALPLILLTYAVLLVVFHGMVWVVVSLVACVQARTGPAVWPGPIIVISSLIPADLAAQGTVWLGTGGTVLVQVMPGFFYHWLIAEMFGLIYFRYVRFHIDGRERTPPPPAPAEERSIVIGAEPVPLSRLHHIEAREHHVLITMDGESVTQRARLGDIVAQTGPEDGLQPHRSWWVSSGAARDLIRDGAKHMLQLDDGTRVPVARTRLEDVRRWLERRR